MELPQYRVQYQSVQQRENVIRTSALVTATQQWTDRVRGLPVTPTLPRRAILDRLARYDFAAPVALAELAGDVEDLLAHGTVHATHPRYFGLFNPTVRAAGVVADTIAALYNPQVGGWWHAPAANELEHAALAWFVRRVGLDPAESTAVFTSGGSEANHMGVLAALTRRIPGFAASGARAATGAPVFYASDQAHDSFVKIAHATGLGRGALRRIRTGPRHQLDVAALRSEIARDRAAGRLPFLVVGTAGTTASGAIDPLDALAAVCRDEELSLHVDAAWGGIALLTDRLAHHLAGIARADSVTWDAHKTLPVPMGAGMFIARGRAATAAAFAVHTAYLPDGEPGTVDLYQHSLQWSRRCIGLKVFMTLAELGAPAIAAMVDHQVAMTALLRSELAAAGWTIENDSPLPIVCFSHPALAADRAGALVRTVVARGEVWLSEVRPPSGPSVLRACVTHADTTADDVRALIGALAAGLAYGRT
jgi:glutamate/tyrosine decarboxylase-like PLP-dependent enzyme